MYSMLENTTTIDTLTGLVVFSLGGKEYCADIREISAIINPNELSEGIDLSGPAPAIKINELQIPIIDLHKFYGLTLKGSINDRRILTVEPENKIFGFVVDRVKEIFTMNRELKSKLEFIPSEKDRHLVGVLNYEGRILYLPDFASLNKSISEED
jgi:chemotaxis signal transduction protein